MGTQAPLWASLHCSPIAQSSIGLASPGIASFISRPSWPVTWACVKHTQTHRDRVCRPQIRTTILTFYGVSLPEVQPMLKQQLTMACQKIRNSSANRVKISSFRHKISFFVRNSTYFPSHSRSAHRTVRFDHWNARKALLNLPLFVISS